MALHASVKSRLSVCARQLLKPPCTERYARLSNNSKIQSDVDGIFIFDFFNTIFIFVFHMNYICSSPCYITLSSNFVTNSSVENMLNNRLKL